MNEVDTEMKKKYYIWILDFTTPEVKRIGPFYDADYAEQYADDVVNSDCEYMIADVENPTLEGLGGAKEGDE